MIREKPSSEFIDLAWDAALAANKTFDELRQVERTTEQLREVGRLGLDGVIIEDHVYETLEDRHTRVQGEFETLTNMAAPAMLMRDSPFSIRSQEVPNVPQPSVEREDEAPWQPPRKIVLSGDGLEYISQADYDSLTREIGNRGIHMTVVEEEMLNSPDEHSIFDFEKTVRNLDEIKAFAEIRGYDDKMYSYIYNVLTRRSQKINVDSYEEYETSTSDAAPDELILVMQSDKDFKIDIRGLYNVVRRWQEVGKSDISYFGDGRISFLADYLNNAILDLEEPLVVTHDPAQSRSNKEQIQARHEEYVATLRQLPLRELLLDAVGEREEKKHFVTPNSFKRYVLSRGYPANKTIQFPDTFQNLADYIDPDCEHAYHARNRNFVASKDDLYYQWSSGSGYRSNVRGITPERFIKLIESLEESGEKVKSYGDFTRQMMHDYLDELNSLSEGEEKSN